MINPRPPLQEGRMSPRAATGGATIVAAQLIIGNIGIGNTSTLATFSATPETGN